MKRLFLLVAAAVAAIAFAVPATAGAASFKGVVIAKKPGRDAFVTASKNGVVRTVRARGALKRIRVGRLVAVRAAALPDGTFAAKGVKLLGKARRVHFRGTVVAVRGTRLFVSAGGSVFALRVRTGHKTGASEGSGGLKPGDEIDCDAGIKGGSLEADGDDVDKVGHSDQLVLEGIYLATADDGTIELAVVHRGRVFVKVPDGLVVPDFATGDQIALVVTVGADGSFVLVKAENEEQGDDGDDEGDDVDIDAPKHEFAVVGALASLDGGYVTVKVMERERPVRCAVPDGYDLSGFAVGDRVVMACKYRDGDPVLVGLEKKAEEHPAYIEARGKLTGLDDGSITVQPDGHDPVTCVVPDGFDLSAFAVGNAVVMWCIQVDGDWTLKAIKKVELPPPPGEYLYAAGKIMLLGGGSITIQGDHEVTCAVPDGFDLTGYAVGDAVGLYCVDVEGTWTLKAIKKLYVPPPPDYLYVTGSITALDHGQITVQGDGEPVTCAVPDGADLSAFVVGDSVTMKCVHTDAGLRLYRLQSDTASWTAP
jgi:hypothetical protein